MIALKYATVVGLYVLFSVASAFAGVVAPVVALLRRDGTYLSNVMHSMDMLLAALLGWDGRSTVSKECGREVRAGVPCRFCRLICRALHYILEEGHCEKESRR